MPTIDSAIREFTALSKQQRAAIAATSAAVPGGPYNASMTIPIGTRVLDLLSGEKGTVIGAKRANVVVPTP
jgi:hypothetical protein